MESWKTEWPVAEALLVWLGSERGAWVVASTTEWYAGPIPEEGQLAGDGVHAAPPQEVADEDFTLTYDDIDDFLQALIWTSCA